MVQRCMLGASSSYAPLISFPISMRMKGVVSPIRELHVKAPDPVHPMISFMVPLLLVEGLSFDQRCLGRQS